MRALAALCMTGACLLLAACATPVADIPHAPQGQLSAEIKTETGDILEKYVRAQNRLMVVGGPLLLHNAALCPRRALTPGFTVHSDFDLPKPLQDVAYERLLLGADPVVLAVIPGSAAWHAGIRPGDTLLTMNGRRLRNAADMRARLRRANIDKRQQAQFGFMREGHAFAATLPFVPICNYRLLYNAGDRDINAYATGTSIAVTQGMMDFTDDRGLAVIIGHELAHNIMHHIPKQTINHAPIMAAGIVIEGLTGFSGYGAKISNALLASYTHVWSPRFEKEADYIGLYLVARAGGDTGAAAPFWRRFAAERGMSAVQLPHGRVRTHPDAPERFVVLSETKTEIDGKIRRGQPLMPNLQAGRHFDFGRKYWPWENADDSRDEPDDRDLNH